ARPQLPRPHQRHRLESVREGDAGDHRPGALHEEEGRSLLDPSEAGAAHRLQALHRCSAWMVLSRPFVEYLIWGWDNLPRTVLMYYANFISSPEGYFHTVACNADEFRNTTVNHDLHYIAWDNPPMQHPHLLTLADWDGMLASAAPFARKFRRDDPVLDRIDADLLSRAPGMLAPGGWCVGEVPAAGANRTGGDDPCAVVGNAAYVRPGPGAARLKRLVTSLLSEENFRPKQCKVAVVEQHIPAKKVEEHIPSEKVEDHH
uniref:Uncharacterized protein n=1 Tax=Aegilops tauschii subsp. strangulata TaxID=200361 RepID=A0A453H477_AEGTS